MEDQELILEVLHRSKNNTWCQECLENVQRYEEAYHCILNKLTEEEQEQLDLYIGACEALCESHMFIAFELGQEHLGERS